MAVCSNSIVLPDRRLLNVFAMRPLTALALGLGCIAHAARVALFGEQPSAPRRLAMLMAQRAFLAGKVRTMDDLTCVMGYAEASHFTAEKIEPVEDRIDEIDAELLRLPPCDLADAVLKVRHLVELHRRYLGALPDEVMQEFLVSFEGRSAVQ